MAYAGICGSDLHVLQGDMDERVRVPAILGHEMSGVVAALGEQLHRPARMPAPTIAAPRVMRAAVRRKDMSGV